MTSQRQDRKSGRRHRESDVLERQGSPRLVEPRQVPIPTVPLLSRVGPLTSEAVSPSDGGEEGALGPRRLRSDDLRHDPGRRKPRQGTCHLGSSPGSTSTKRLDSLSSG